MHIGWGRSELPAHFTCCISGLLTCQIRGRRACQVSSYLSSWINFHNHSRPMHPSLFLEQTQSDSYLVCLLPQLLALSVIRLQIEIFFWFVLHAPAFCLHHCLCTVCIWCLQRPGEMPQNWSDRRLWATTRVVRIELRSPGRAVNALHCQVISLVPLSFISIQLPWKVPRGDNLFPW